MTAPGPGSHLLVAGGAGFIGSCFVRDVLGRRDGTRITVLDKLTYAGNRANLGDVEADAEMAARFAFVRGDIADASAVAPGADIEVLLRRGALRATVATPPPGESVIRRCSISATAGTALRNRLRSDSTTCGGRCRS